MPWFAKSTENSSQSKASLTDDQLRSKVDEFVSVQPQAVYLIDGQKGVSKSVICRKNENGGQTCLNLEIDGITLFKEMQGKQYFCSLPAEVNATHFECRKIQ